MSFELCKNVPFGEKNMAKTNVKQNQVLRLLGCFCRRTASVRLDNEFC